MSLGATVVYGRGIQFVCKIMCGDRLDVGIKTGRCDLKRFAQSQGDYSVPPEQRPPEHFPLLLILCTSAWSLEVVRLGDYRVLYADCEPGTSGMWFDG